jgi:CHAT domain-containing protein
MAKANEFRAMVTDTSSDDYLEPAQQLYQWMIAPIQADLQKQEIDNLVFILDPGLRSLPLAAMHDGKQFLVETYSVGMMPSLALTDTTYVNLQNSSVLAMGASVFKEQNPLPAVPQELALIKAARRGTSFLNEEFTLANLKAARSQTPYSIVHLATHGEFKAGDLSQSYIQFWDSRLRLDQIRTLGFNNPKVELLVLSACRTALGNEDAELGFAGLAFKAGVRTVLGSLWYVSDEGTLNLMSEFYTQLASAPIRSEALRQAQLSLIQATPRSGASPTNPTIADLSHPYYWAAFTMVGNPW